MVSRNEGLIVEWYHWPFVWNSDMQSWLKKVYLSSHEKGSLYFSAGWIGFVSYKFKGSSDGQYAGGYENDETD